MLDIFVNLASKYEINFFFVKSISQEKISDTSRKWRKNLVLSKKNSMPGLMNLSRSMRGSNSSLNSLKNFKENMNAARSLSWSEMKRDSYSLCSFNLADGVKK